MIITFDFKNRRIVNHGSSRVHVFTTGYHQARRMRKIYQFRFSFVLCTT